MTDQSASLRVRYLDLIEDVITNQIYGDAPIVRSWRKPAIFDRGKREIGRDLPSQAHSMIGRARMRNLRTLVERAIADAIPGDIIETGVWRGGACIYARAVLEAWGERDRIVWVADSFAGLPPPDAAKYPADRGDKHHQNPDLAISRSAVEAHFRLYGLLDDQVRFLEGWFKDTLPAAPIERLAVMRLDGDMYESTMDALRALYHRLSPGGYAIIDDYGAVPGCKAAVHDFLDAEMPDERIEIEEIDWTGVFWRRPGG